MYVDQDSLVLLLRIGGTLDLVLTVLVVLAVPAAFVWFYTRDRRALTALKVLLIAGGVWLLAALIYFVALLASYGYGPYALLLLLVPLAVVYGLRKARRRRAAMIEHGRGLLPTAARMLPLPFVVLAALAVATLDQAFENGLIVSGSFRFYGIGEIVAASVWTGNAIADSVIGFLRLFGYGAIVLFFLSLPYVAGSLLAILLLIADRIAVRLGLTSFLALPDPTAGEPSHEGKSA